MSTPSEIFEKKVPLLIVLPVYTVLCNVPHVPFGRHYAFLVHRILVFLFLVVLFLVEGAAEKGAAPGRGGGRGGGAAGAEAAVVVPEAAARSAAVAAAARRSASAAEAAAVLLLRLSVLLTVVSTESQVLATSASHGVDPVVVVLELSRSSCTSSGQSRGHNSCFRLAPPGRERH